MKTTYKIILVVIGLFCLCLLYRHFDPGESILAPKCPIWLLTGYKCPGCGSQRAIHSFLHGNLLEGIRYNYLLLPSLAYAFLLIVLPSQSRLKQVMSSYTAGIIIAIVYVLWWVLRNVSGL